MCTWLTRVLRIILIYRTPSCNTVNSVQLIKVISDFSSVKDPCLVLGDFNLSDVDWKNGCAMNAERISSLSTCFIELFNSHAFMQMVPSPTKGLVCHINVVPPVGGSDHSAVEFSLNLQALKPRLAWKPDFGAANYDDIMDLFDRPILTFLLFEKNDRNIVKPVEKAVSIGSDDEWNKFKNYSSKLDKKLHRFSECLEKKVIDSRNPSKLYSYIRSRIQDRKTIPALVASDGDREIVFTDEGKAEVLARQFQKSFATTATDVIEDGATPLFPVMEPVVWFYREDIVKILSRWPSSTSITPDFLPLKFIKK
ncbi:hypothetical protein COOONC_06238, partial [Cooperia oncophora]